MVNHYVCFLTELFPARRFRYQKQQCYWRLSLISLYFLPARQNNGCILSTKRGSPSACHTVSHVYDVGFRLFFNNATLQHPVAENSVKSQQKKFRLQHHTLCVNSIVTLVTIGDKPGFFPILCHKKRVFTTGK